MPYRLHLLSIQHTRVTKPTSPGLTAHQLPGVEVEKGCAKLPGDCEAAPKDTLEHCGPTSFFQPQPT